MLPILTQTLKDAPIVRRGDYHYFIHPITDGVPELAPALLSEVADRMIELADTDVDRIVTIESMGIPVGTVLAMKTGIPLVIIRKRQYNLPNEIAVHQHTGYSKGELYLNGINKGDRVMIVDDVISTGGTMKAVIQALEIAGAEIRDIIIVIERGEGASSLRAAGHDIKTLVSVDVDAEGVMVKSALG
ncbi:MAG TPA: purine phosphoribosyltransferase family protein [Methanosarcinales archaeon]|nr:purine phosphoribosyltransferase family protein [Methanosarcinales archaeon]